MFRLTLLCAAVPLMAGCAQIPTKEPIYAVPYNGQDWTVLIEVPPGKTRAQAEADGSAQYVVDGQKRFMRCNGTYIDCRNTLVDLRERVEALGDSSS